jgi:predicted nucleotidyltransferase
MVKIKKGETVAVNMAFIPFTLEQQLATLVFRDEKVGEFQYDLTGLVESTNINQESLRIPQILYTNKKYQIEVQIPTRNDLILRARKAAEYLADKLEKKMGTQKDQKVAPINYEKYYPKLTNSEVYTAKLTTPNSSIILKS